MNIVLDYFKKLNETPIRKRNITVYGWQFNYEYILLSSVTKYLFEDLKVYENIAKETNENRDLRIREKKYITIHDTGDTDNNHTSLFWSNTVYNEKLMDTNNKYHASFQYVVGNDGIYHNIPDDEIAYHAGDSTKYDYKLYDTGLYVKNVKKVSLIDGYYAINDLKTKVLSPADNDSFNINDGGILIVNEGMHTYIGETYYNETYKLIANRGGNNNSIGIEVCVTKGDNLYYNYQLTAKLVASLLKKHNLTINDIKQHHYFSGKDCPMTLRHNNMWDEFLELVQVELDVSSFIEQGYFVEINIKSNFVLSNGVISSSFDGDYIDYDIITIKDGAKESISLRKQIIH